MYYKCTVELRRPRSGEVWWQDDNTTDSHTSMVNWLNRAFQRAKDLINRDQVPARTMKFACIVVEREGEMPSHPWGYLSGGPSIYQYRNRTYTVGATRILEGMEGTQPHSGTGIQNGIGAPTPGSVVQDSRAAELHRLYTEPVTSVARPVPDPRLSIQEEPRISTEEAYYQLTREVELERERVYRAMTDWYTLRRHDR